MRLILLLICAASLSSCRSKVICSAFQSTYILHDSTRYAYYSYIWELDEATRVSYQDKLSRGGGNDSLGIVSQPKTDYYAYAGEKVVPRRNTQKTKYGIIKYEPYWLKNYRMRTAPKENVLAPEPITTNFVASDFADSLSDDSLSIADRDSLGTGLVAAKETKKEPKFRYGYDPKDNFNVEQEYYNKHFGKSLIDDRPEPVPEGADTTTQVSNVQPDSVQTRKISLKGLFKLFKKKNKKEEADPLKEEDESGNEN